MSLLLAAAHFSATGARDDNEDFAGMRMPAEPAISSRGVIVAVADGVSGSYGGREAAEWSVRDLLNDYYTSPQNRPVTRALDEVIQTINRRVHHQGSQHVERGGMATTLTCLVLHEHTYHFAHVGDSRLYLLRHGRLQQLTTDHVADQTGMRHVLTRAIGLDAQVTVDLGSAELQLDDIFLLASDGVWAALSDSDIEWHLSTLSGQALDPDYTAKLLVNAALANGSQDNLTAAVVRVLRLPEADSHNDSSATTLTTLASVQRDPLLKWKIIGAASLAVNLLFFYWLLTQ
jgi:serine/threonine protein phosphatase PrpC